jgi:hypothetical protein
MALEFGLGQVVAIPSGANVTPIPLYLLTEVSIDISYKSTSFRGPYQFPLETVMGEGDIKIKAKPGDGRAALVSAVLQGSTAAAGTVRGVQGEAGTIPGTPYQVTVSQSATFSEDLGVLDLTANKWLTRVASAPATGQYSVSAGVYTFAAADTTHNLSINYSYTSAANGQTITLNNQLVGTTTTFGMRVYNVNTVSGATRYFGFYFPRVLIPKLGLGWKPNAYRDQSIEAEAMQDSASQLVFKPYMQE